MIGFNGGLVGKARDTGSTPSLPGVWTLGEQIKAKRASSWASNFVPTQNFLNSNVTTQTSGTAALTGADPFWIDITPSNATFDYFGGALNKTMDGNTTTTYVYWVGSDHPAGGITRIRLELVPRIISPSSDITTVRFYSSGFSGYGVYTARLLDASKALIANTSANSPAGGASWTTVPVTGFPCYLEFVPSGINPRMFLFAIEINGSILVDT